MDSEKDFFQGPNFNFWGGQKYLFAVTFYENCGVLGLCEDWEEIVMKSFRPHFLMAKHCGVSKKSDVCQNCQFSMLCNSVVGSPFSLSNVIFGIYRSRPRFWTHTKYSPMMKLWFFGRSGRILAIFGRRLILVREQQNLVGQEIWSSLSRPQ